MAATVMWHTSAQSGAPQVTNAWGSLVALLDAVLVNGWGSKTVATLTSTAAGVATATVTAGHTFVKGQVVQVAGATETGYNGYWTVTGITATTFTYQMDVPGTVRTATTTTSITAKASPCRWTKTFTGTNKGAYRGSSASTTNHLLVDNSLRSGYTTTWAKFASVGIVSALSDVNTITGIQAPYEVTNPTRNWVTGANASEPGWAKWWHGRSDLYDVKMGDGGTGNRDWVLVGNGKFFYLFVKAAPGNTYGGYYAYAYGDLTSYAVAGDSTGTLLVASEAASEGWAGEGGDGGLIISESTKGHWLLRSYTQLGLPVRWMIASPLGLGERMVSGKGPIAYPNGPDNGLWTMPIRVVEEGMHVRGELPGLYWLPQYKPVADGAQWQQVVNGSTRTMMAVAVAWNGDAQGAFVAIDLTGPW